MKEVAKSTRNKNWLIRTIMNKQNMRLTKLHFVFLSANAANSLPISFKSAETAGYLDEKGTAMLILYHI